MITHLYHYACAHAAPQIRRSGVIRPNPVARLRLAWFTDLRVADRQALGLTSHMLACDRTEYRFTVAPADNLLWWPDWCRANGLGWRQRDLYEGTTDAQPGHWWVSSEPQRVIG